MAHARKTTKVVMTPSEEAVVVLTLKEDEARALRELLGVVTFGIKETDAIRAALNEIGFRYKRLTFFSQDSHVGKRR